ncbi:hypothetical protein [Sodalis sp. C49]|uniref:hypothetical protein n=1 Tax=Sodalis sp. C49 TaxID=3228929 RepID=UPI003965A24F
MEKIFIATILLTASCGALAQGPYNVRVENLNDCDIKVDAFNQTEVIITQGNTRTITVPGGPTAIYPASRRVADNVCTFDQTLDLRVDGDTAQLISYNWNNNVRGLNVLGFMGGVGYSFERSVTRGQDTALGVINRTFINAPGYSRLVTMTVQPR